MEEENKIWEDFLKAFKSEEPKEPNKQNTTEDRQKELEMMRRTAEAERIEKVNGAERELEREKTNEQGMQMDLNEHGN